MSTTGAGMSIRFDPGSVSRTQRSFNAVKKYATGGAWNMLNKLTLLFIRSAVAGTPIAKTKREVFRARNAAERRAIGGFRYAVKFPYGLTRQAEKRGSLLDGQPWVGTNSEEAVRELSVITYRGAAKASWGGMFKKMGVTTWKPVSSVLARVVSTSNWVKFIRTPNKQSIVTVNRFTTMDKIAPGIRDKALLKARASFDHQQRRQFETGLQVAWRSAA